MPILSVYLCSLCYTMYCTACVLPYFVRALHSVCCLLLFTRAPAALFSPSPLPFLSPSLFSSLSSALSRSLPARRDCSPCEASTDQALPYSHADPLRLGVVRHVGGTLNDVHAHPHT